MQCFCNVYFIYLKILIEGLKMKKYVLVGILPLLASTALFAELGYTNSEFNNAKNNKKEVDEAVKAVNVKTSEYGLNLPGKKAVKVGSENETGKPDIEDHDPTDSNGGTNPASKEEQQSGTKEDDAQAKRDADVDRRLKNSCANGSATACKEQERREEQRKKDEEEKLYGKWTPNPTQGSNGSKIKGSKKQERELQKLIDNQGLGKKTPIINNGADGGEGDTRADRDNSNENTNNIPKRGLAGDPCDGRTGSNGCGAKNTASNIINEKREQFGGGNNPRNR